MRSVISLIRFIVYSNLFVSLCATALTKLTYLLLKLPEESCFPILLLVFCSTYFTYNFQRIIRLKHRELLGKNIGIRLSWIVRNRSFLFTSSILIGIIGLVTVFYINTRSIITLIPLSFLSIFYVLPIIPYNKESIALRKIPFVKIFVISAVWSLVTVALPYFNEYGFNDIKSGAFLLILFKRFLFIFAITLPFDIRDLRFDLKSDLKTIPHLIGVKKTIYLAEFILLIFIAINFLQFIYFKQISLAQFISLLVTTLITAIIISFSTKRRPELFFSGLLEGTMILIYLSILILESY